MLTYDQSKKIIFNSLIPGHPDAGSKLDYAYVEFVNGAAFAAAEMEEASLALHFDSFENEADKDYLRLPITYHKVVEEGGKSVLKVSIICDEQEGHFGKSFSAGNASRVFAVTLVASQPNDRQDVFFARHTYPADKQLLKPDNGSVSLELVFE
jgi:hypothetical protein